jgi:hypothetical protein
MRSKSTAAMFLLISMLAAAPAARADPGCTDFKWDATKERALFSGTADSISAGTDLKSAPTVVPNRLYQLQLMSLERVNFALTPGKKYHADGEKGGIATLRIPAGGSYRIALDLPVWIDVVADGSLIPARDFQGQHDCTAPHKIVEFDLAGDLPLVLQVSGSTSDSVRLTVTASPPRKL